MQRATRRGHWFWSAVLAQRFVYRDVMLAALLVNVFALAFPLFSMNVYDRVVPNNAVETLWALAIGVTLILLADLRRCASCAAASSTRPARASTWSCRRG